MHQPTWSSFSFLSLATRFARRSTWLRRLNVPGSFVGGLAGSLLLLALNSMGLPAFGVSEELRDILLIVFFVCAGLGTPVASWLSAGRPLVVLSILVSLMMVFQNVIGIGVVTMLGAAPSTACSPAASPCPAGWAAPWHGERSSPQRVFARQPRSRSSPPPLA